jgi:glucan-binding YG repeat protein
MDLNVTEIDDLDDDVEDIGFIDTNGDFTPAIKPVPTSRVPMPRITTMAHKNRGSLAHPEPQPQPARKVTYDDILSSLNMKVVDGKLQIVRNVVAENIRSNNFNQIPPSQQNQHLPQIQKKYINTQNQNQHQSQQQHQSQRFQSMHQQQQQQEMQLPTPILTKEQYKQLQIANYIKEAQRIQHIRNTKSTKLKFSNTNTIFNISPLIGNTNDLNKLFHLKGVGNR